MNPPRTPPRLLRVQRIQQLSPQLRRVFLGGPDLAGFPLGQEGSHIKLLLARPGQNQPVLPTLGPDGPIWPPADQRPISRTYTVAGFDPARGELAVDFVMHGDNGPASRWASHARLGDAIGVAGPAAPPRFQPGADFYLLIGDPSALAMLAAVLAALPAHAQGMALIEVPDADEILPLAHPPGVALHWLSRHGAPAGSSTRLFDLLRSQPWPAGKVSVSLAGESNQVVAIRDWLLREKGVRKQQLYAVPYWKDEQDEEAYHAERHRIMDQLLLEENA